MDIRTAIIMMGVIATAIAIFIFTVTKEFRGLEKRIDQGLSNLEKCLHDRQAALIELTMLIDPKTTDALIGELKEGRLESVVDGSNRQHVERLKAFGDKLNRLTIQVEKHPALNKEDILFKVLQKRVVTCEEAFTAERRSYNRHAVQFNKKLFVFPDRVIAKRKHVQRKELFITTDVKRVDG